MECHTRYGQNQQELKFTTLCHTTWVFPRLIFNNKNTENNFTVSKLLLLCKEGPNVDCGEY